MIELSGIYKKFSRQTDFLFENVSCKIQNAEMVLITGPSSCGKSTLLRMIAAREKPTRGQILIRSKDINSLKSSELPFLRRQFGETAPDIKLLENKSVLENIALALTIREANAKEIKNKSLLMSQLIGLNSKTHVRCGQLSSFEQNLVRLGRALIAQPAIILCDEPFEGCDETRGLQIAELLGEARANGSTVIIATKHMDFLSKRPKRQIVIRDRLLWEYPVTQYPIAR